ncbi:MAG: hypothetical protein KKE30_21835 [Gammaproteobacteria bacterium]|nr:hypothetical protein [Gammaproteobacteria bacterium]MBU1556526.1 hypothetical protein [Gammaproteobacteria bacterium]MBU2071341.1 hypothetical protein [Gammaproteobacteria bacterium]MBU2182513.1 hypothetical protein [Gammaproteobacteria bacterium]MBU2204673.1 hypothetical protein [Gammaproteobacteria bacterium]
MSGWRALLFSFLGLCFPLQACLQSAAEPVNAVLAATILGAEPRQVVIYNNLSLATPTAAGVLALYNANNLQLLDQLQRWPVTGGQIGAILAQPAVLDNNYDGIADAVYLIDAAGLLWFVGLGRSGFAAPELIADFSGLGYRFEQPLQLIKTRAPALSGQLQYQVTLLLTASDSQQSSIVIALKHRPQRAAVAVLSDLTDRSSIAAEEQRHGIDEQLWMAMQQSSGWYVRLPRQLISKPQVYAGVVYLLSAKAGTADSDCTLAADAAPLLHALHLHHAGLVYTQRAKPVALQQSGELALEQSEHAGLQLVLQRGELKQSLETELQAISAECADCTEPLTAAQFPQLIRLATFQTEYGAH